MRASPIPIRPFAHCRKFECLLRCLCLSLLMLLMLPLPARAVDWDKWREHLENWISAAGTQVPDPVGTLVTAVSAVPAGTRWALTQKCHQNMQRYYLELDAPNLSKKREQELNFLLDKHQNVLSALGGKPDDLKKMMDDLKAGTYQPTQRKPPTAADLAGEEKQNMEDMLARYRRKVDDLLQRAGSAADTYQAGRANLAEPERQFRTIKDWAEDKIARYSAQSQAEFLCQMAQAADDKAKAYAVAVYDNEKACDRKLKEADAHAAICRTKADGDRIVALYEEARKLAARMEKDLEEAQMNLKVRDQSFQRWQEIRETLKKRPGKAEIDGKRRELNDVEQRLRSILKGIRDSAKTIAACAKETQELGEEIRQAALYYVKHYPDSNARWQALKDDLTRLTRDARFTPPKVDQDRDVQSAESLLRKTPLVEKYLYDLVNIYVAVCPMDELAVKIVEEAAASRDAALLNLAANEHLLDKARQCGQPVATAPQGPGSLQPPPAPPAPPPSPVTPVQLLPGLTNPNAAGGLFIQGPARMISGDNTTYTAADGAGNLYTSGITWNASVNDVLAMDRATGQATALRAGRCTIVAHRPEPGVEHPSTAFLDVTVLARVPDLTGLTGKEALARLAEKGLKGSLDDPTGQGRVSGQSLAPGTPAGADQSVALTTAIQEGPFSTSGGDGNAAQGSAGFGTSGGESLPPAPGGVDCTTLKEEFTAALQAHDGGWAQQVLNRSLFCDFYASGHAQLGALNDRQAEEEEARQRNLCEFGEFKFNAALNAGSLQEAQAVLHEAAGCPFLAQAQAALNDAQRRQHCENLIRQFYAQVQQNNLQGAQGSLNAARMNGCPVGQQELSALQQAGSRAQQQSQQFYNTLQGILQNMPVPNTGTPPASTGGPTVRPPANPPNLPTINRPGTNVPPAAPTQRCQDVCVEQEIRYRNITDGRHGLCKGPGKAWTGAIWVTCEQVTHCLKWEKQCK